MKIVFNRLANNNLPLPKYATPGSAAFDLSACLTRMCKEVKSKSNMAVLTEFALQGPIRKFESKRFYDEDNKLIINPGETVMIPTGFKSSFTNAVLQLNIRSSLGIRNITLANNTGIIDSDYRGEIFVVLFNESEVRQTISHGERIAQGILLPLEQATIEEGTVDITDRGEGGFGSTNK